MKKLILVLLSVTVIIFGAALSSCKEDFPESGGQNDACVEHTDKNADGKCDICQKTVEIDNNNDSKDDAGKDDQNNGGEEVHKHTYSEEWSGDGANHWREITCGCENVKVIQYAHTDLNKDGVCDVCKKAIHSHSYDTGWTFDGEKHWHSALCGCADALVYKTSHSDKNSDGVCDICEYTVCAHTYQEEWKNDENYHWRLPVCLCQNVPIEKISHKDGDADGVCDDCEYLLCEHRYSDEWSFDGENHWHSAICGHTDLIVDKAEHSLDEYGFCEICLEKIHKSPVSLVGGTMDEPTELRMPHDFICKFPGGYNCSWFAFVPEADGYVTLSTTLESGWLMLGDDYYNPISNAGTGESVKAFIPAGVLCYIAVGDFEGEAIDVPFTLSFEEGEASPDGSIEFPYVIGEAGDYTAQPLMNYPTVHFVYTAKENGYITVSSEYSNPFIKVGADPYFAKNNMNDFGTREGDSITVYMPAGTTVYIGISDFDFVDICYDIIDYEEVTIPFKVEFEAFESESFEHLVGSWIGVEKPLWGVITHKLSINADGGGTYSYNIGWDDIVCDITYIVVRGSSVIIGYEGEDDSGMICCTYENGDFICEFGFDSEFEFKVNREAVEYGLHYQIPEGFEQVKVTFAEFAYKNESAYIYFNCFSPDQLEEMEVDPNISVLDYTNSFMLWNNIPLECLSYDEARDISVIKWIADNQKYEMEDEYFHIQILRGENYLYVLIADCNVDKKDEYIEIFDVWHSFIWVD